MCPSAITVVLGNTDIVIYLPVRGRIKEAAREIL